MDKILDEDLWGLNEQKYKKYNVAYNTSTDKKIYNSKEYHAWSYMLRLVYDNSENTLKSGKVKTLQYVKNGLILLILMSGSVRTIIQLTMNRWTCAEISWIKIIMSSVPICAYLFPDGLCNLSHQRIYLRQICRGV